MAIPSRNSDMNPKESLEEKIFKVTIKNLPQIHKIFTSTSLDIPTHSKEGNQFKNSLHRRMEDAK